MILGTADTCELQLPKSCEGTPHTAVCPSIQLVKLRGCPKFLTTRPPHVSARYATTERTTSQTYPTRHAALVAEITQLRRQQLVDLANEVFCGTTHEQEVVHQKRSDHLALLVLELEAINGGQAKNVRFPVSVTRFPGT